MCLSVRHWRSSIVFTAAGIFCSPDQTVTFEQLAWSNNTEIVKYPQSAIGHRLSATKVYENNVPSLDWHGLKNFKDFEEFVNVSFFYPNSWTAPKAQDGYINKFISQKKTIYTFRFCLWSALCMSNTILTVLWIFFKCITWAFLFLSLCWIVNATQTCQIFVNVVKMWKRVTVSFSSISSRTDRV